MKVLNVEFAPPHHVSAWLWGSLTAALLLFAVDQTWQAWGLHQQAKLIEQQSAELAGKIERLRRAKAEAEAQAKVEPPYARDAAAVARLASFPLDKVLASIENARVPGIKMTSLDISAEDGSVRAELEYADNDALMRYLEEINAGEPTPRWRLVQAQNGGNPTAMSTASVVSNWTAADR